VLVNELVDAHSAMARTFAAPHFEHGKAFAEVI